MQLAFEKDQAHSPEWSYDAHAPQLDDDTPDAGWQAFLDNNQPFQSRLPEDYQQELGEWAAGGGMKRAMERIRAERDAGLSSLSIYRSM